MNHQSNHVFEFSEIGWVESCFKQKFGIPRQPGLVAQATAKLYLHPQFSHESAIRGLEQYSHLWILFVFHQSLKSKHKSTVRPPRLGGKQKLGVFATRSNYRPNPIGQSVVKLDDIESDSENICLHLSGVDILDQSPVIDIKPYIPYSDSLVKAEAGMAQFPPEKTFYVEISDQAETEIRDASIRLNTDLRTFICDLLAYDPRPAFQVKTGDDEQYATRVFDFDLVWRVKDQLVEVVALKR